MKKAMRAAKRALGVQSRIYSGFHWYVYHNM
jgi:hypothetical protein